MSIVSIFDGFRKEKRNKKLIFAAYQCIDFIANLDYFCPCRERKGKVQENP